MKNNISKEQLFDAIITTGLPIGLFIVDGGMNIIEFNRAAEELTGWKREEALGRQCSEVFRSNLCGANCLLKKSAFMKKAFIGEKAVILSKWGEEIVIFLTSSAILDEDGRVIAGIEIFKDGTESAKLEAQRKNFISVFTHDLKHPVAIIGGLLARLLKGKAGDLGDKQREYLETVYKENLKLNNAIHNFLDTMQLQAGKLRLNRTPCSLERILFDLVREFKILAREKGISLDLELPESLPILFLDQHQLEQALSNYLDNAIKYSRQGDRVMVRTHEEHDFVVVEVQDQGAGISREDLSHVFEYFYRAGRGNDRVTGTGLGLASTRGIVEAHGGKAWVRSEEGGVGSSFFMRIPKEIAEEPEKGGN